MKTITSRRLVLFFGILLIAVGMIVGGTLASAASPSYLTAQDRIAVTVSPTASQPSAQLTGRDAQDIADTLKNPVTWWAIKNQSVLVGKRQTQADVFLVGGPFQDFHPQKMLYGSFLSRLNGDTRSIVLDRDLAWQLFGTENAVGMDVKLGDVSYTVTGVCDTDTSLLGLLSQNGPCAYIQYGDSTLPVQGMEASLPKSLPGKSLQAVKDAFSTQGKTPSGFLFQDSTETARLDAEVPMLPGVLFACILTVIAALWAKNAVTKMIRSLRACMEEKYLAESWREVLLRIAKMALVCAAAAGAVWGIWMLANFPFFLPGRFIPGSWIDLDFYKNLLKTQAQQTITAMGFPRQSWQIARDAGMQVVGYMNMAALAGLAIFAAGLALVRDARAAGETGGRHLDLPVVWIFLIGSVGIAFVVCQAMGLAPQLPWQLAALLCAGLSAWAVWVLYREIIKVKEK